MTEQRLNEIMLEVGYAAPYLAVRAKALAKAVEAEVTKEFTTFTQLKMNEVLNLIGGAKHESL